MIVTQPSIPVPDYERVEPRQRRLPRLLTWGVVGVGGFMLLVSILLPNLCGSRETANRAKCASNLHQIGLAILLYQQDHGGAYPDTLGRLAETEQIGAAVFVCPSGNDAASPSNQPAELAADVDAGPDQHHCSYLYLGRGLTAKTATATTPIVFDAPEDHNDDGVNVLYGDGHVDWEMPSKVVKLLPPERVPKDARWQRALAAATLSAVGRERPNR
jgi:prepilin-type processing-associated H-X9-DG protein